jgi:hypothetical protein
VSKRLFTGNFLRGMCKWGVELFKFLTANQI